MTTLCLFLTLSAGMGGSARVLQAPLPFGSLRQQLTLEYIRQHYDPAAKDILIHPRMIVIHWTGSSSLKSLLATFEPDELPPGRPELVRGGRVNVSTHYAVDRDGTIYQLMPKLWMARHTIGLNRVALGIENVGGPDTALTEAQLSSCAWLTRKLVKECPDIEYLIGHFEYLQFKGTPLWEERNSEYLTQKPDPAAEFMSRLRERLKDLPLRNSYHPYALQDPYHGRHSGETNAPLKFATQ